MHIAVPATVETARPAARWRSRLTLSLLLASIFLTALAVRASGLDTYGFSEDEVAKLRAIDAYRSGDFTANAEHPMLMKLAMWASLASADQWNRLAPSLPIAPEIALRLPNALAGSATTLAIYGAGSLLLGPAVGLVSAALVAVDPTIIAIHRIGKEDTLLMLFFFLAVWCYEKAKRVGATHPERAQRWYSAAGACFGLMVASKYLPHLIGLNVGVNMVMQPNAGANAPRPRTYYPAMIGAFLCANFAVLFPSSWAYGVAYIRGATSTHHGYLYDGQLYVNAASAVLWGVPWTYYLRLVVTKTPLPVLAGMLAGIVLMFTRRHERGFVWMRFFLVIPLLGHTLIAAKFQRYALPILLVLDMLSAAGLVALAGWWWSRSEKLAFRGPVSGVLAGAVAAVLVIGPIGVAPYFSIYQNRIGTGQAAPATVYPEESYDYGVREAVGEIAAVAGPGAAIVSDASLVVEYYVGRTLRHDLEVRSLSQHGVRFRGEQWILVQDSHVYFENATLIDQLRRAQVPWREYRLGGTSVLQVFKVTF
jgi:hypothetical protein